MNPEKKMTEAELREAIYQWNLKHGKETIALGATIGGTFNGEVIKPTPIYSPNPDLEKLAAHGNEKPRKRGWPKGKRRKPKDTK